MMATAWSLSRSGAKTESNISWPMSDLSDPFPLPFRCGSEQGSADVQHDNLVHREGAKTKTLLQEQWRRGQGLSTVNPEAGFFLGLLSSANDCTLPVLEL